jgi:L,D-transpeptidase catalytic domain
MRFATTLILPLVALTFSSCVDSQPADPRGNYLSGLGPLQYSSHGTGPAPAIPDDVSYWDGDDVAGKPSIRINRSLQKAFFYKDARLVGVSRISTGEEGHNTPPGNYKVTEKDRDHFSSVYGVFKDKTTNEVVNSNVDIRVDKIPPGCNYFPASMKNFLRFNGGIGMHTGYLPGYAASHGCIRMPDFIASKFFDNANLGTPVIVE